MVGYGGTGKSGRQYHYYKCKNSRKNKCDKKVVGKNIPIDEIEETFEGETEGKEGCSSMTTSA